MKTVKIPAKLYASLSEQVYFGQITQGVIDGTEILSFPADIWPEEDPLPVFKQDTLDMMFGYNPRTKAMVVIPTEAIEAYYELDLTKDSPNPTISAEASQAYLDQLPAGTRVTPEDVDNLIDNHQFMRIGDTTTVCQLYLRNGFKVVGTSFCMDPANYREEVGEQLAYQKAKDQLWELEAYARMSLAMLAENAEA